MHERVCDGTLMSGFTSGRLMCDHVKSTASVCLCIVDVVIMRLKAERDVSKVICTGCTDNGDALCESSQECFEFLSMFKSQMSYINLMKNIQRESI